MTRLPDAMVERITREISVQRLVEARGIREAEEDREDDEEKE